uniref:Spaetzle domain-containing protein n=1 Tax=Strongyloides venezuelensis TaxID=75913 RepID=A0A0K0EV31_STRVS
MPKVISKCYKKVGYSKISLNGSINQNIFIKIFSSFLSFIILVSSIIQIVDCHVIEGIPKNNRKLFEQQQLFDKSRSTIFEELVKNITEKWKYFNIEHAIPTELHEYKRDLTVLIEQLDEAIQRSDRLKLNKFLPISSILPDMKSGVVKKRLESLKNLKSLPLEVGNNIINIKEGSGEQFENEELLPLNSYQKNYENDNEVSSSEFDNTYYDDNINNEGYTFDNLEGMTTTTIKILNDKEMNKIRMSTKSIKMSILKETDNNKVYNENDSPQPLQHRLSASIPIRTNQFIPTVNHTTMECQKFTQAELINELKQRGTYNPDLMAWDTSGLLRFIDRTISDQYESRKHSNHINSEQTIKRNIEALERILMELDLKCDVRQPKVIDKIKKLSIHTPRRTVSSPSIRIANEKIRSKRRAFVDDNLLHAINQSHNENKFNINEKKGPKIIGEVYIVPFGCDKRGEEEDGYLRLCGACQGIRRLPQNFFPPFINEVMCDEDKSCLYFYDFAHGRCNQKHMNFVVLRNVGTSDCQIWEKYNLNVRVSCECFVDETSFFAKYV